MPRSASALVANHRIALAGSAARASVATYRVGYIAERRGVVRDPTVDDLRMREAMLGYAAMRPGAEGPLFNQAGAVALADARRELASNGGAVCCTVLSVRREDAAELGLETKEDWERYVRANWPQAFSRMSGVPESRVRYVAAFHLNSEASYHVHVISWDDAGLWDSTFPMRRMEQAREALTEAAIAPAMARISQERSVSRDRAAALVRDSDVGVEIRRVLPSDGSLDWAHLRRYHPEAARSVSEAVSRAVSADRELSSEVARHGELVLRAAELKGLTGAERERYVADARRGLEARLRNAALRAAVPDRTARPDRAALYSYDGGATPSPSAERRRQRAISEEFKACLNSRDQEAVLHAAAEGKPMPRRAVRSCPTLYAAARRDATAVGAIADATVAAPAAVVRAATAAINKGESDDGDRAARKALDLVSRIALAAAYRVGGPVGGALRVGVGVARAVSMTIE